MDSYTIGHKGLFFKIFSDYDLSFTEVRGILDYLMNNEAFNDSSAEYEGGKLYSVIFQDTIYDVDVYNYEIIIYRKMPVTEDTSEDDE